ncbi:MAG: DUF4325 domain-containing protein [Spirochaetaceae bacterium]|nr:DUF4325 domain-containing protein [Spirochaetaceae bacterium]
MAGTRERGRLIRRFIAKRIDSDSQEVVRETAREFGISRQAVNKHLRRLVDDGHVAVQGTTRNRRYSLSTIDRRTIALKLGKQLDENQVWRQQIVPLLPDLAGNAMDIWAYSFQEMLNNAIDHSSGMTVAVDIERTTTSTEMTITDDGYGIFKKIEETLDLEDERHAVFELTKGKLTTDPDNHTGEGIFFTSRMFDEFSIDSGGVYLSYLSPTEEYWVFDNDEFVAGTRVRMKLSSGAGRTPKEVFDAFTGDDDYAFTKTVVPVDLARYGNDALISRSQARRVLARLDRFNTVVLNFKNVDQVGQGFADQVFRVFARAHPDIALIPINADPQVMSMIKRANPRI